MINTNLRREVVGLNVSEAARELKLDHNYLVYCIKSGLLPKPATKHKLRFYYSSSELEKMRQVVEKISKEAK